MTPGTLFLVPSTSSISGLFFHLSRPATSLQTWGQTHAERGGSVCTKFLQAVRAANGAVQHETCRSVALEAEAWKREKAVTMRLYAARRAACIRHATIASDTPDNAAASNT